MAQSKKTGVHKGVPREQRRAWQRANRKSWSRQAGRR